MAEPFQLVILLFYILHNINKKIWDLWQLFLAKLSVVKYPVIK